MSSRTGKIYDRSAKRLTEIGQLAQGAWYAAYDQDPAEFSALQDNYGYQAYYLPVERILRNSFGLDISGRADLREGPRVGHVEVNLFEVPAAARSTSAWRTFPRT